MPTIVGILTFMSRIDFSLSSAEHEKGFITLGPGLGLTWLYSIVSHLTMVLNQSTFKGVTI